MTLTQELDISRAAFGMLHEGVQRQLYRMNWTSLRPLQVSAIQHLMSSDASCILSAATAAGKTEAAFLPVLSKITGNTAPGIKALYIGPLRALINDQFERIGDLCNYLDVPVHKWHGDVNRDAKARLLKTPDGVLLITPESLESLFVNHSQKLGWLFGALQYIVIDELHSFLRDERGRHLKSLLSRLAQERRASGFMRPATLLGLSATLGDFSIGQKYLSPQASNQVTVITEESSDKELLLRIHTYLSPDDDENLEMQELVDRQMAVDMVKNCGIHANLMFANRKVDVEAFCDLCQAIVREEKLSREFLVHHGALSKEVREDTEGRMKSGRKATTFCSSTLEMGIDIGSVRSTGQIGVPFSVASLKQRVGRSGRRDGEPRILRMYLKTALQLHNANDLDELKPDILQAIAITRLLINGWVEPEEPVRYDFSTLAHQVMSVIAQRSAVRADVLYKSLCASGIGGFDGIAAAQFGTLLRGLASKDIIEQTPTGELILGLTGEKLRSGRDFYAVFQTPQTHILIHGAEKLGEIEWFPHIEELIIFAGRRWTVTGIDPESQEVFVKPATIRGAVNFHGNLGHTHAVIRREIRLLLADHETPPYLDQTTTDILERSRAIARRTRFLQDQIVSLGPSTYALMTWTGSREQATLMAMLKQVNIRAEDCVIAIKVKLAPAAVVDVLRKIFSKPWTPDDFDFSPMHAMKRKYDPFVPPELLHLGWVEDELDIEGALAIVGDLIR